MRFSQTKKLFHSRKKKSGQILLLCTAKLWFVLQDIALYILMLSVLESGRYDDLNLIYKLDKPGSVPR